MSDDLDDINEPKPMTNDFVDKVTLELLMNKNHYNRYLSQSDPKKHQEHLEHLDKIKEYKGWIINMTNDFLNNPNHQVTTEVNDAFDSYVRTLVRHFEIKKMENEGHSEGKKYGENGANSDEDILFGSMQEDDNDIFVEPPPMKSYWGKNQVVKKSSSHGFPMNYIPRVKDSL
jgi:hypothetical protein